MTTTKLFSRCLGRCATYVFFSAIITAIVFTAKPVSAQSGLDQKGFLLDVGPEDTVLTPGERAKFGLPLAFPDGLAGFIKSGSTYFIFGPAGGENPGTLRLQTSSLENLLPSLELNPGTRVLEKGIAQPFNGDDFDLNYAAGGPVYSDITSGVLLHFYHGEYHYDSNTLPFYSALGIAISFDFGKTFQKLGPIIKARIPRTPGRQLEISGASIVAQNGKFFLYYTDQDSALSAPCNVNVCIAVASAPIKDVVKAALQGRAYAWRKYYKGSFSTSGLGGRFSPIVVPSNRELFHAWPSVAYNQQLDKFIMTYMAGWSGIALRTSDDGLKWSHPTMVQTGRFPDGVVYPMLVGMGNNPSVLNSEFWLYYINHFPYWESSNWVRRKLRVLKFRTLRPQGVSQHSSTSKAQEIFTTSVYPSEPSFVYANMKLSNAIPYVY